MHLRGVMRTYILLRLIKELCDWHFKDCAGMGADKYTQDGVADLTRQKLMDFVRAVCDLFVCSYAIV